MKLKGSVQHTLKASLGLYSIGSRATENVQENDFLERTLEYNSDNKVRHGLEKHMWWIKKTQPHYYPCPGEVKGPTEDGGSGKRSEGEFERYINYIIVRISM